MAAYDGIVLGTGGVGSAALAALARRGARVLGLDQFPPAHDRGSSHGQTRLIRQAYFEHPDYVPLVLRSYVLWAELAARRGVDLFHETGLLQVGPPNGQVLAGVIASAKQHNLAIDSLSEQDIKKRWAGFTVTEEMAGVYERRAGLLYVERCVQAHLDDAQAAGAELRTDERVIDVQRDRDQITLTTPRGRYTADRLVITAGPWAGRWLAELGIALVVRRKPLFWFATNSDAYRADVGCPAFLYETSDGVFYGFPQIDEAGLKVAEHSGGQVVTDPTNVDRAIDAADQARVEKFLARYLPGVSRTRTDHIVCLYTMSADEHFIVDTLPDDARVSFAAGLSGHGFKFAPVLGEALADLALVGTTTLPIEFLSCWRPALRAV